MLNSLKVVQRQWKLGRILVNQVRKISIYEIKISFFVILIEKYQLLGELWHRNEFGKY